MIPIIQKRNHFFILSGILVGASLLSVILFGLRPGIDFTGGTLLEVSFTEERPSAAAIEEALKELSFPLDNLQIQPSGDHGFILRTRFISEEEHQAILGRLRIKFQILGDANAASDLIITDISGNPVDVGISAKTENLASGAESEINTKSGNRVIEDRIETIGPSISAHLRARAWQIGIAVLVVIILYIAYTFRKVSKPIASWKYGVTAVIALLHDISIPIGVFAILGKFFGVEIDIPFIVALLTILGYSVNDTIVVFDRIRENLIRYGSDQFEDLVNKGVNDTLARSINTSFTTLLVLIPLFFFGAESIKYFALALIIGIVAGTYSSIFLASPFLVAWEKWSGRQ